jgi:hypothetical protein
MKMKTSLAASVRSLGLTAAPTNGLANPAFTTGTTSIMQMMKKSRFMSAGFVRVIMMLFIISSFVTGVSAEMDNQVSVWHQRSH